MIKSYWRSYLVIFVAIVSVVLGGLNSSIVSAATAASNGAANGFTISPVLTEITVSKGESQTVPITISNPTAATLIAQPVVNDFVASNDESGTPLLILKNNVPLPANNFKSLVGNIQTTTLGPNQSAQVPVTITVPKNALSGGYYGAVRFIPGNTGNQSNVGLTASVGTLFLVTVPGNLTTELSLVQLSAADTNGNASSFFTNGQLSTLLRIRNTGNIYTQPQGTIVLKDMWGKILTTQQFNNLAPKQNILPDSIRKFVVDLPHRSYFGHYTLTVTVANDNSSTNLITSTTSFWYIPAWAQILGLIIVIIIVALIYWIVHSLNQRRFSKK